jgi:hypothetical protein
MLSNNGGAILQTERVDEEISGDPATGLAKHSGKLDAFG